MRNSEVYGFDKAIVKSKALYFAKLRIGAVEPQANQDISQTSAQSLVLSNFVSTCFFEVVPTILEEGC